jgi:hypothetical protein
MPDLVEILREYTLLIGTTHLVTPTNEVYPLAAIPLLQELIPMLSTLCNPTSRPNV